MFDPQIKAERGKMVQAYKTQNYAPNILERVFSQDVAPGDKLLIQRPDSLYEVVFKGFVEGSTGIRICMTLDSEEITADWSDVQWRVIRPSAQYR